MNRFLLKREGSTLVAVVIMTAVGAMIIAGFYQTLIPKYRSVYQSASWHDALQGAEAGANCALEQLNQFALTAKNADNYDWEGKQWTFTNALYRLNGERTLATASLPVIGGQNNVSVTRLAVDVYTRRKTAPNPPWFRIRSTATADLPGRLVSADKRDAALRRMKLSNKNAGKDAPYVSRTVEVIAKPRFRFSRAITTEAGMVLGQSSKWIVDSFDSTDPNKSDPGTSAGGVYPSSDSERQSNGNIATNGSIIVGNGAIVKGDVSTNGGDNPATETHENVTGSGQMDQDRIFDSFDEDLPLPEKPVWSPVDSLPKNNTGFLTGTAAAPTRYVINGQLGSFSVIGPTNKNVTGYVEIIVNGNLDLGNGNKSYIEIPENVYATIYVDGNVNFGNGEVNSNSNSSKVASRLTVYGVSTATNASFTAAGNPNQYLSFYGPNYDLLFKGTSELTGSVVGKSFTITGGGNGGVHYDEALGVGGDIAGWELTSYFEDSRADL
ncbi:DUF7305 domain-containing protein [Verrucomicrobiota bacterium sgz303538]